MMNKSLLFAATLAGVSVSDGKCVLSEANSVENYSSMYYKIESPTEVGNCDDWDWNVGCTENSNSGCTNNGGCGK